MKRFFKKVNSMFRIKFMFFKINIYISNLQCLINVMGIVDFIIGFLHGKKSRLLVYSHLHDSCGTALLEGELIWFAKILLG